MNNNNAKDLFQLQSELVNSKVDMAVSNAIERVMDELSSMRKDIHSIKSEVHRDIHAIKHDLHAEIHVLRRDMDNQFSSLKERVTAVESTLSYLKHAQAQISTKFIDYTFKAGWLIIAGSASYMVAHFFGIVG